MPNTKSARKRLRQNAVRRLKNRMVKATMRTQPRKVRDAAAAGDLEKAEHEFRVAAKKLDRAGRITSFTGLCRTKSRLQRLIKTTKAAKQPA